MLSIANIVVTSLSQPKEIWMPIKLDVRLFTRDVPNVGITSFYIEHPPQNSKLDIFRIYWGHLFLTKLFGLDITYPVGVTVSSDGYELGVEC